MKTDNFMNCIGCKAHQLPRPWVLALLLVAALLLGGCGGPPGDASYFEEEITGVLSQPVGLAPASMPQPEERRVSFSAVGDNLIHSSLYTQAQRRAGGNGYDFIALYQQVAPFFAQFDINWMNQESLITNFASANYPCFSTPEEIGPALYDAGWRVFALANNHTYDQGAAGIAATRHFWAGMPDDVVAFGLYENREDDKQIALHTVSGITFAYLAFTEHTNTLPTPSSAEAFVIYTHEEAAQQHLIGRARQLADVVVVGVHWGVEYSHTPTNAQRALAEQYAQWGADVVVGTHPHVMQPVQWVEAGGRRALVAYSLGNFASAQDRAPRMVGLCLAFDAVQMVQPDGTAQPATIENVRVYPTVTHYEGGFANNRTYMLADYTDELAAAHGVRGADPQFSLAYIRELAQSIISPEFLVLSGEG